MKKYTNKILIVAISLFVILLTVIFFTKASEIKKELYKQENTGLIIKHQS
jgi:regulatory protein YycI of two-component signal transduction system YycFG